MTAIDVPPPHEGGQRDAEDVATLQKQATGSQMKQREQREGAQGARSLLQVERRPVELHDNETIQGDKFFSLSDHSSWSSNEQLDLEADKTSSEFESEVSSLALGKELQESGRSATVRKKQRKRSEDANTRSLQPSAVCQLQAHRRAESQRTAGSDGKTGPHRARSTSRLAKIPPATAVNRVPTPGGGGGLEVWGGGTEVRALAAATTFTWSYADII
ncbi:hypothetical protein NDU88_000962 [Pleurodeles waltl]|uniref:Uncharacterized protein n=1 Tax=Pleurodeles waltl TaxID=8319 RepID=A0AAV7N9G6_PLEWA|nr:hypothetical protein NDU88_000962 [Pleurodeles waltl]